MCSALDKKRSEDDIKELDAKNKITRDMVSVFLDKMSLDNIH